MDCCLAALVHIFLYHALFCLAADINCNDLEFSHRKAMNLHYRDTRKVFLTLPGPPIQSFYVLRSDDTTVRLWDISTVFMKPLLSCDHFTGAKFEDSSRGTQITCLVSISIPRATLLPLVLLMKLWRKCGTFVLGVAFALYLLTLTRLLLYILTWTALFWFPVAMMGFG